ncbi:MAG TPA: hypothetical protein PKL83_05180, partial [bacterium]|nr:hypothetical protein [bacterium]
MIEGAGGEIGPDDTQAELERQLDIDKEAQQEQDQPEYTFEYSEIEAPTWEAAMAELGEKVAEDARRLLAYRIKSAREDGSLKRKITLAQKVYANLIAKQQTFADGTSERFLIDGYLASLKARSKAVLTDNPWELFGLSSAGYSSENVSAEELALYEQNDNLGCITVTVRIGENILIVHVEEDHVNLSRKLNYTTRLVKFTVDGKEVVCFVYPHLLPGIGFVASPDRVQVDDLMPTCHEYTDEAIAQLDRAGLSNMVGHMLLLNEQLPEDKRLTIQQIG